MTEEELKWSAVLVQTISAIAIAIITTLTGFVFAWPSYTMEMFRSNSTVLSEPMTTTQISLLGSLTSAGGLLATPLYGYLMDKLGRKYTAMVSGLPYVVAWALISTSTSVYTTLAAVTLTGVGAAGQASSAVYISEICQDKIRGVLLSTTVTGFFIGLLISNVLGSYLSYYQVVHIFLVSSIAYVILLIPLKESPVSLMQFGEIEEAKKSIAFYRRIDINSKHVEIAINEIKIQVDTNLANIHEADDSTHGSLLKKPSAILKKPGCAWRFLKNSQSSKRALAIVLTSMVLSTFIGTRVLQIYSEALFKEAIPTLSSNTCRIILSSVFLLSSIVCTSTIDQLGRKFLMTSTAILSGIFNIILGSQFQWHWAPHWFTAFVIYSHSFIYNMGVAAVPCILPAEVFLPEVRGICSSICMACMWISCFVLFSTFTPLAETCGFGNTFYIFSIVSLLTASFSHFYLPETKGLSVEDIQLAIMKIK